MVGQSPDSTALDFPKLPVGSERFHRNRFIDYQFRRLWSEGFARDEDLRAAASRIHTFADHVQVFTELADQAEAEGRLRNAAFYLRSAEFFTPADAPAKRPTYERFVSLFDRAFADTGIERTRVPYRDGFLPVLRLGAGTATRGTLLFFGGFDSLIEEFVGIWARLAEAGFDVVAFEGPGQGGALALGGLTFEHDWEKPVGAILDHLGIERAALVGMSMGGYWAIRAAAHEPRIDRVVAWGVVYDWLAQVPAFVRPFVRWLVRRRGFMRWSIGLRARLIPILQHAVAQTLYISGRTDLADVPGWFMGMNAEHVSSARVHQDVLLMAGNDDTFQPPRLAAAQAVALVNAKSVATRFYRREEQAASHCQMGNLGLAIDDLLAWLGGGSPSAQRG